MYDEFQQYDDLDDVIITSKRDIRGNRYGFVAFFNVSDDKLLVVKLDYIFIGRRKLFANLLRFQRRGTQVTKKLLKTNRIYDWGNKEAKKYHFHKVKSNKVEGRSYEDEVKVSADSTDSPSKILWRKL